MNGRVKTLVLLTVGATLASLLATGLLLLPSAFAVEHVAAGVIDPGVLQWGFLAAALATGMSSLGAGYAVGAIGSAAVGALAEKPELLGRVLILIGLAEGIAIYGLLISILIFNQIT